MRVDNIPKPEFLWYEDQDGNKFSFNAWNSLNKDSSKTWYQHTIDTVVRHDIYQGNVDKKWPVRFLKWLIRIMPASWHGKSPLAYSESSSINCTYPIIKYLVETKGWYFEEACVVGAQLCERCLNICIDECQGTTSIYTNKTNCDYCKYIDPVHLKKLRVWRCCYRSLKFGGNIAEAWNDNKVTTAAGYWDVAEDKEIKFLAKVKEFFNNFRGGQNEKV